MDMAPELLDLVLKMSTIMDFQERQGVPTVEVLVIVSQTVRNSRLYRTNRLLELDAGTTSRPAVQTTELSALCYRTYLCLPAIRITTGRVISSWLKCMAVPSMDYLPLSRGPDMAWQIYQSYLLSATCNLSVWHSRLLSYLLFNVNIYDLNLSAVNSAGLTTRNFQHDHSISSMFLSY